MINIYRQGDLGITQLKKIPQLDKNAVKGKIEREKDGYVLALGEVTGHRHLLVEDEPATKIEILDVGLGRKVLKIMDGSASLKHEEHKTITIQPGFYIIQNEKEYDYFKEERRFVAD